MIPPLISAVIAFLALLISALSLIFAVHSRHAAERSAFNSLAQERVADALMEVTSFIHAGNKLLVAIKEDLSREMLIAHGNSFDDGFARAEGAVKSAHGLVSNRSFSTTANSLLKLKNTMEDSHGQIASLFNKCKQLAPNIRESRAEDCVSLLRVVLEYQAMVVRDSHSDLRLSGAGRANTRLQ